MKTLSAFLAMCLMLLTFASVGCVNASVEAPMVMTQRTVGQQLMRLQKKYQKGDLTNKEYERQKARIIASAGQLPPEGAKPLGYSNY